MDNVGFNMAEKCQPFLSIDTVCNIVYECPTCSSGVVMLQIIPVAVHYLAETCRCASMDMLRPLGTFHRVSGDEV